MNWMIFWTDTMNKKVKSRSGKLSKCTLTPKEIEAFIKNISISKNQGLDGLNAEFYQKLIKGPIAIFLKLFSKIGTEGPLHNSLYEATVTLIP